MSSLGDTLANESGAILDEVSHIDEVAALPREVLRQLFHGLLQRVRLARDRELTQILDRHAAQIPLPRLLSVTARVASAMRRVVLQSSPNKRVAIIASQAIDRALADTLAECSLPVPPVPTLSPVEGTDPTIIRNIREILAETQAEQAEMAVLAAVTLEEDSTLEARLGAVEQRFRALSGLVAVRHANALAACFRPRVGNQEIRDGLDALVAVAREPEARGLGLAIGRGKVHIENRAGDDPTVRGAVIARVIAMAGLTGAPSISCDQAVAALVRDQYLLLPTDTRIGAAEILRLDTSQPQWIDRWERASLLETSPLMGRDDEARALQALLATEPAARRAVCLRGRAGSGRRRLLSEVIERLGLPRTRVLWGHPHAAAQAPYWPLAAMLRQLLDLTVGPVQEETLGQRIAALQGERQGGMDIARVVATLGALLNVQATSDVERDVGDREARSARVSLGEATSLLLRAAADQQPELPFVLVIEDAQGLDRPTLDVLRLALDAYEGQAPFVLVFLQTGTAARLRKAFPQALHELALEGLPDENLLDMARAILDTPALDPQLEELLVQRARGLPLVVEHLIRALVEGGHLRRQGDEWQLLGALPGARLRRPTDIVAHRLESLPAHLVGVLRLAAVLGTRAPQGLVSAVGEQVGVAVAELQRHIKVLCALGFFERVGNAVRFCHGTIRDAVWAATPEAEQTHLHAAACRAYLEVYPGATGLLPVIVYHHASLGGLEAVARESLAHGLSQALRLGDDDCLRGLVESGETLVDGDSPEMLRLAYDVAWARDHVLDAVRRRTEQEHNLHRLMAIADALGDDVRRGLAVHRAARLCLLKGNLVDATSLAERARDLLLPHDQLDASNVLRTLAVIHWQSGRAQAAADALHEALRIYTNLDHRRGEGMVLYSLGLFALDSGAPSQAEEYLQRALALRAELGDRRGEALTLDALAQVALLNHAPALAVERLERSLALKALHGTGAEMSESQLALGQAQLALGQPQEALALAEAALPRAKGRRALGIELRLLASACHLALDQGSRAARMARAAHKMSEGARARVLTVRALLANARADAHGGSPKKLQRAAATCHEAVELATRAGARRWRTEALLLHAEILARSSDARATQLAREVLDEVTARPLVGLDNAEVRDRAQSILAAVPG